MSNAEFLNKVSVAKYGKEFMSLDAEECSALRLILKELLATVKNVSNKSDRM